MPGSKRTNPIRPSYDEGELRDKSSEVSMLKRKGKQVKEKPAIELTRDEAMERIFGKEITDAAKKVAHQKDPVDAPFPSHEQ